MTKECELCGGYFDTDCKRRKYCDRCGDSSDRKKMYAKINFDNAQKRYDAMLWKPTIFNGDCDECGKHMKKEYKYVYKRRLDKLYYFCSKECMRKYEAEYMMKNEKEDVQNGRL